jgi:hypothetical protein
LKKQAQGFNQLEMQVRRQAAHVMVALDTLGLGSAQPLGFDHIW